ncbi:MAG: insulinase family protein [Cephaloticoccus sp.]
MAEINSRRTVSGQASRLGVAEVVVGDLGFSRTYFQRLATLRPMDLRRVLRAYLVPETSTRVSLNPKDQAAAVTTPEPASVAAPFQEFRLPNGARLLLRHDPSLPNVHLRLCALAGAQQEPADRRGLSSLLATLLTKDTRKRSAAAVAQAIESVGGSFHAMAGNNTLGLALEVLPSDFALACELLGDALLRPVFRTATLDHERDAQLAALQDDNDNVVSHGLKLLRRRFFGAHPLAVGPHGDEASLARISPKDLRALHRRILAAENVVLVIAGDFDAAQAEAAGRQLLGALPRRNPRPLGPEFVAPTAATATVERQPRRQAVVFEAYPGPAMGAADYFVSEVVDELFSGMSSRLFERVRDELGLAYYVRSARVIGLDASMFYFYAGTEPGKEAAVLKEITAEIRRVARGGVAPAELRRCQVRLKAAHRMGLQTNSSRAMQAALNVLYGRPADDTVDYDRRIDAVTRAYLAAFARKYFRAKGRTRLTIRP